MSLGTPGRLASDVGALCCLSLPEPPFPLSLHIFLRVRTNLHLCSGSLAPSRCPHLIWNLFTKAVDLWPLVQFSFTALLH